MSYNNPRITLDMNLRDIVIELCDGNPGAITAMMNMIQITPDVDPDDMFGELGPMLSLDTHDIYGPDIYILWNDLCSRNTIHTLALLRSCQLGFCGESELHELIRSGYQADKARIAELVAKVRERLPRFCQTDELPA